MSLLSSWYGMLRSGHPPHGSIGYAVACLAFWLMYMDRQTYRDAWRCRRWKSTRAIVTKIREEPFDVDVVSKRKRSRVERRKDRRYHFQYSVERTTYHSERYSFNGGLWPRPPVFKLRSKITLYYDPTNPGRSVVKRDIPPRLLLMPLVALGGVIWASWGSWF